MRFCFLRCKGANPRGWNTGLGLDCPGEGRLGYALKSRILLNFLMKVDMGFVDLVWHAALISLTCQLIRSSSKITARRGVHFSDTRAICGDLFSANASALPKACKKMHGECGQNDFIERFHVAAIQPWPV